jgi:peptide/nickel transport system permease protein
VTLKLGGLALAFALVLSIPLIAAALGNSWIDRIALLFALFGQAMPTFWFTPRHHRQRQPALAAGIRFGTTAHFILPAIALGYYAAPT